MTQNKLADMLADTTASLENVMAHYGHLMSPADQYGRNLVIAQAQALLREIYENDEEWE